MAAIDGQRDECVSLLISSRLLGSVIARMRCAAVSCGNGVIADEWRSIGGMVVGQASYTLHM